MGDGYPEYLNPFAEDLKPKSKLTVRNSFRELKKSLRQSFRLKKKDEDEPVIRRRSDNFQRLPMVHPSRPFEALPRSRFHERVSCGHQNNIPAPNPFDDGSSQATVLRKKGKKRAPLPPKSLSSQQLNEDNLQVPVSSSNWSLTSVETNSDSVDVGVEKRGEGNDEESKQDKRESLVERFVDFNKNMDAFIDDTNNNNVIIKEESKSNLLCHGENETIQSETNKDNGDEEVLNLPDHEDISKLDVQEIPNNTIKDDSKHKDQSVLYCENTSLYVTGSVDNLNHSSEGTYTENASLYLTGSCENNLDDLKNNINNNGEDEVVSTSDENVAPVPKNRKNKLTRDALLGVKADD